MFAMNPIALLSVSNKKGLLPLAESLVRNHHFDLISSGGTAKIIEKAGLPVTRVADFTGAPEILGGRVKTLHPRIHGGILANLKDDLHKNDLKDQNIPPINLVVVNLYPFQEVIKNPDVTWDEAIENIDIGGPTLIRAAAKNHARVAILTRPDQYNVFLENLKKGSEGLNKDVLQKLALEAFEHTASYDIGISRWLSSQTNNELSNWLNTAPTKQKLRYGENPHQKATWFSQADAGFGGANQLQGKELSANNLLDLEAAVCTVKEFGYETVDDNSYFQPAAVVIKHTNPCGVAVSDCLETSIRRALDADRVSAFGGIVALNTIVNKATAEELSSLFLECIVAPEFSKEARLILSKKSNLRLLELKEQAIQRSSREYAKSILGGFLIQEQDDKPINTSNWKIASKREPTDREEEDLLFAWKVTRHVRSNAIVIANSGKSLGIGAGQMNRVGAARLALDAAGKEAKNAVLASDGFFPFDDTVRIAGEYGIKAIIQPGGSIRDNDSIKSCNELGIKMVFTGKRHFLH